jgi:hypothetical protein
MPVNVAWTALPCIIISLLLTSTLFEAIKLTGDIDAATLTKAACAFLIILALTTFTTKLIICTFPPQTQSLATDVYNTAADEHYPPSETRTENRASIWPMDVFNNLQRPDWPSTQHSEDDRQAEDFQDRARAWEKKEEKRIRKMLAKDFRPMRNTLLGSRREPTVEVTVEPPRRTETLEVNGDTTTRRVGYIGGTTTQYVSWSW